TIDSRRRRDSARRCAGLGCGAMPEKLLCSMGTDGAPRIRTTESCGLESSDSPSQPVQYVMLNAPFVTVFVPVAVVAAMGAATDENVPEMVVEVDAVSATVRGPACWVKRDDERDDATDVPVGQAQVRVMCTERATPW